MAHQSLPLRTLEASRVVLEPQQAAHADEMFGVLSDPAIYEFENQPPASADALRERFRKLESACSPDGSQLWLNWIVRLRDTGAAIGYVQATVLEDARALIAYEFGSAWWGRGLAQEATTVGIYELRTRYGVTVVGAVFKRTNHRSRRLLERLGMHVPGAGEFPAGLAESDEDAMVLILPVSP